jgi:peptide chain release factor 2
LFRGERGVHRLVRISPFDSNKRRHTSFASVTVIPEIKDNNVIEIKPEEIRIDTYRSSGAGGQHINKTDSAIRITHFPTGIVVTCQNQRSQIQNRETALQVLKSKLYEINLRELEEKKKELAGVLRENGFGSQIRSYILQPYLLVKDHRTNTESTNPADVLDGNIDIFIDSYLKWSRKMSV